MSTIPGEINELQDGEKIYFGDSREFSIRKDASQLVIRDEANNNDISTVEQGVDGLVSNGEKVATEPWVSSNSGGISYIQSSEPTDPSEGESWLDSDNGVFSIYADVGNGLRWNPVSPVRFLQESTTFSESNVTVSGFDRKFLGSIITDPSGDVSASSYSGNSVGMSGSTNTYGLHVGNGGNDLYVMSSGAVERFTLSTSWDFSTASNTGDTYDVTGQDQYPRGITFKDDGTKMYVAGTNNGNIYQYGLSTAWDITSASYEKSYSSGSRRSLDFNSDGTKLYAGKNGDAFEYELSTAWDIGTVTATTSEGLGGLNYTRGLTITDDGTALSACPLDSRAHTYRLSTPDDLSTISSDYRSIDIETDGGNRTGLHMKGDGMVFGEVSDYREAYQHNISQSFPVETTISWDSIPDDIDSWDIVAYQITAGGGSVTLDIVDSSGNVLLSDIVQNEDISTISTSTDVQIRATFDYTSGDYPALDYAARRMTR